MLVSRKLKNGMHIHRKVKFGHITRIYHSKKVDADVAAAMVQSHQRIFISGNCAVPQVLLAALVRRAPMLECLEIFQLLSLGSADFVQPEMRGHLLLNTAFISDTVRKAVQEGRADFTPCFLSEVPKLLRDGILPLDVAFIHISPPDKHGWCSLGVEAGLDKTPSQVAKLVIAEVNDHMPRVLGDSFIHLSEIDYVVPVSYPLPELELGAPTETSIHIAAHIATLIEDGSTIQTGIGEIPNAVLGKLKDKKDLGVHTELFSDGIIELVEKGVITCDRKTLHPGKIVAGFVLGTQALYDFINDNPLIELCSQEYVNDPFVISQNDKMVAINSAIEVDITGQVCADSIGSKLYSGVGGQVDFIYGASRSNGGKPIIALPSATVLRDGTRVSKITPMLLSGAGVTTTRNHVRFVVTEFGIADLYGKTIRQRANALINIAHPDFQEELERKAREMRYIG